MSTLKRTALVILVLIELGLHAWPGKAMAMPLIPPPPAEDQPIPQEIVMAYFMEVGFGAEYGDPTMVLHKWAGDIRIRVYGAPTVDDMENLLKVVSELNDLLQGSVKLRFVAGDGDINIYFIPPDLFAFVEPMYVPGNTGFFVAGWYENGAIIEAKILIASRGVTEQDRFHLIREELTQSLGLFQDSWQYQDSIFYQGWTGTVEYSAIDREVIRLLYSPLLRPGMSKEEVLEVLKGK